MCGRFTLRARPQAIVDEFGLFATPGLTPRYNIAPTQQVGAVREDANDGQRRLTLLRWGLVPSWAKEISIGNRLLNARAETVATTPAFRAAFAARRCLIVADGFYEWQKTSAGKQPYLIERPGSAPFAFAGLWECWGPERLETCTIITTTANDTMRPLHERMPVILLSENYATWLNPECRDRAALVQLLQPAAADLLEVTPVSTLVNNARNETAECVRPVA